VDKQNWIAALENTGGRPEQPSCGACQANSSSSQISNDPGLQSAPLLAGQFFVRKQAGLLIQIVQANGFPM